MHDERPELPLAELRAAAGNMPDAHGALGDFHSEYSAPAPDPARLSAHAERIRGFDSLAGSFERWWLSPSVQGFVSELNATGI